MGRLPEEPHAIIGAIGRVPISTESSLNLKKKGD
jgi:hypothetical protein